MIKKDATQISPMAIYLASLSKQYVSTLSIYCIVNIIISEKNKYFVHISLIINCIYQTLFHNPAILIQYIYTTHLKLIELEQV